MADDVTAQDAVLATLPTGTKLATKDLGSGKHAGLVVVVDPADRTHGLKPDVNGAIAVTGPLTDAALRATPVPVSGAVTVSDGSGPLTVDGTVVATVADGGNVTQGAKADAAWDGAAAAPTIVAIQKWFSAKFVAMAAALGATTGAAVITDADGTIQQYLRGLVKLTITAATNTVQGVAAYAGIPVVVRQVENISTVVTTLTAREQIGQTGEKLLTLTPTVDGTAGGTVTSYTITAGKRARLKLFFGFVDVTTGNTTAIASMVRIRYSPSGAATTASDMRAALGLTGSATNASKAFGTVQQLQSDGTMEFAAGGQICITAEEPQYALTIANPFVNVTAVIEEYTP